jgi:O-antigen ligase
VVTLVEPLLGLALTLLAGPFGALESVILGGTSFDSSQLLLILTLTAWLARSVVRREIVFPQFDRRVILAYLIFVSLAALSLVNAPSLTAGFKELAKWIQMGLVAWLASGSVEVKRVKDRRLRWLVASIFVAGLSQALIGIWQFCLRGHGPEHFEIAISFRGRLLEAYRAYGTFEQPNPYAGFLGLSLPLALGWGLGTAGVWLSHFPKVRSVGTMLTMRSALKLLLPWSVAGILGLALLASWSRGGWLGAAAGVIVMLLFVPRRRWQGGLLVLLVLVLATFALASSLLPTSIAGRLTGFADYVQFQDTRGVDITPANYAVLERMAHWQAALEMANERPWLGIGFGNYEPAYADYALMNWPYPLGHAHNYYLNLLAETGILGLLAYFGFWGAVILLTARFIGRSSGVERGFALGLMGVWTHLAVHHLVDKLYVNNIYLHLGALLGLLFLVTDGCSITEEDVQEHTLSKPLFRTDTG